MGVVGDHLRLQRHALERRADPLRDLPGPVRRRGRPLSEQEYYDHLAGLSDEAIVTAWLGADYPDVAGTVAERIDRYRELVADGSTIEPPCTRGRPGTPRPASRWRSSREPRSPRSSRSSAPPGSRRSSERSSPPTPSAAASRIRRATCGPSSCSAPRPPKRSPSRTPSPASPPRPAAGMRCIAVRGTLAPERLAKADELVEALEPGVDRASSPSVSRPLVIAHRGASAELPENTLPAFERAIELGADFVELDVHARADGELVVTHDAPRRRTPLPTLAEVLDLCRGRIGVMVELKTPYRYRRHRRRRADARAARRRRGRRLLRARGDGPGSRPAPGAADGAARRVRADPARGRARLLGGRARGSARDPASAPERRAQGPRDHRLHGERAGADARAGDPRRHRHLHGPTPTGAGMSWVLPRQADQPRALVGDVRDDAAADRQRLGPRGRTCRRSGRRPARSPSGG